MIEHAWTVLCDKVLVDEETQNISLDVIDQLTALVAPIPAGGAVLIPNRLQIVSLWYRRDPAIASRQRARVRMIDPDDRQLGEVPVDLDLTSTERLRTRGMLSGVPVTKSGWYHFIVEVEEQGAWKVVANVPLQVVVTESN